MGCGLGGRWRGFRGKRDSVRYHGPSRGDQHVCKGQEMERQESGYCIQAVGKVGEHTVVGPAPIRIASPEGAIESDI